MTVEAWWRVLLDDETRSPEVVADAVRARVSDPRVADVVMRSIRASLDAPDPAVVPSMAALAKLYVGASAERAPDRFFSSATRMLGELDAGELSTLLALLAAAGPRGRSDFSAHVDSIRPRPRGKWLVRWTAEESDRIGEGEVLLTETPMRLFRVLKRNDLAHDCHAEDATEAVDGEPDHTRHIYFEGRAATDLASVIREPAPPR